jgi:hypothetical protein
MGRLYRAAWALALVLTIAGCTKGGQFDPSEILNSDMFDSKKKLKGERTPVFPEGVPGASTGVPAELVKGYEPPPEPADPDAAVPGPAPPASASETAKPKPKPKPKVVAHKPPPPQPDAGPTRITVGPKPGAAPQQPDASQLAWPTPPANSTQQASQSSQTAWPNPPQTAAQPAQSQNIWPNPPPSGSSSR